MTTISKFSFTINIQNGARIYGFTGRIIHGAFLQMLRNVDPNLSQFLHERKGRTLFTITPLTFNKNGENYFGKFEVKTANQYIIKVIVQGISEDSFDTIYINEKDREIISVSYKKVRISELECLANNTAIRFRFKSPVFFADNDRKSKTNPFPNLEKLWLQLLKHYNFLVEPIGEGNIANLATKLQKQLSTPNFNLQSAHIKLGEKIKVTGFVGSILFVIENNDGLEILKPLLDLAEVWGIGGKLSMGFGQISLKVIPPNIKLNKEKITRKYKKQVFHTIKGAEKYN